MDSILRLTSEGFGEDQVLSMPLDKVLMYLDGVHRQTAYRRQEAFSDLVSAIGVAFSGKGFKTYMDSLGAKNG